MPIRDPWLALQAQRGARIQKKVSHSSAAELGYLRTAHEAPGGPSSEGWSVQLKLGAITLIWRWHGFAQRLRQWCKLPTAPVPE